MHLTTAPHFLSPLELLTLYKTVKIQTQEFEKEKYAECCHLNDN